MLENIIEQILKNVELEMGISRFDFISNSRKEVYLEARKKATKLLIVEAQLSDEGIAKVSVFQEVQQTLTGIVVVFIEEIKKIITKNR